MKILRHCFYAWQHVLEICNIVLLYMHIHQTYANYSSNKNVTERGEDLYQKLLNGRGYFILKL